MQALEPSAGDELEQVLARYARVRLGPSPAQTRRARAAVVEEAWRRHIAVVDAGTRAGAAARAGRVPFSTWRPRRITLSLAAAVLAGLLVGSTAFAASRAGGPLYETRLTVETLLLPSDPAERLDAQLARAQARLADIVDASGHNDAGAVAAAIDAYDRAVADLGATTGAGSERARAAVEFHLSVLEQLLAGATGRAADGLQNAVIHSSGVIDRLNADTGPGPANGATNNGGNGSGAGANNGGNGSGAGANNGGNGSTPAKPDRSQPPGKDHAASPAPEQGPPGD